MKNKKQRVKGNYFVYLPSNIVDEINKIEVSKIQRDKMFHFVNFLKTSSRDSGAVQTDKGISENITNYVSIPRNYFRKTYTSKYNDFLNPLIESKIIEVNNSYSNYKGSEKCKEYRISPKWLNELEITKDCIDSVMLEKEVEKSSKTHYQSFFKTCVGESVTSYLYNDLDKYLLHLENLPYQNYVIHDTNLSHIPIINQKGEFFKIEKEVAFAKYGYVIKDKNKYFICEATPFMLNKIRNKQISVVEATKRLLDGDLYARRNDVNNRLDTNFTNFPSEFFEYYKRYNNLVEYDVKNNQFAILAHILPKELQGEDVELFKFLAGRGELYEYVEQSLGLNSRKEAKELLICVLFASYKVLDKRIKNLFPNLCEWIKGWKKENGDKGAFPTMLQKKESEIFIDGVYKLLKKNYGCGYNQIFLTKHDSIVVSAHRGEEVVKDIKKYFEEIGYKCKIK